nr:MAG TPA: hypothetical protein [Caudoviricetes sp.]
MRKSIKTTIFATVFFIGYAVGFLACGAAYTKGSSTLLRKAAYGVPVSLRGAGEEQPAAITEESDDVVHMDQVAGIKATEYGVYLTFYDGTGYWWEY